MSRILRVWYAYKVIVLVTIKIKYMCDGVSRKENKMKVIDVELLRKHGFVLAKVKTDKTGEVTEFMTVQLDDAPTIDAAEIRPKKMKYERISKRSKAGAHPVVLHVECEAKCEPIFKRCEWCDLEKELLNRLADLEDKIENGTLIEVERI